MARVNRRQKIASRVGKRVLAEAIRAGIVATAIRLLSESRQSQFPISIDIEEIPFVQIHPNEVDLKGKTWQEIEELQSKGAFINLIGLQAQIKGERPYTPEQKAQLDATLKRITFEYESKENIFDMQKVAARAKRMRDMIRS